MHPLFDFLSLCKGRLKERKGGMNRLQNLKPGVLNCRVLTVYVTNAGLKINIVHMMFFGLRSHRDKQSMTNGKNAAAVWLCGHSEVSIRMGYLFTWPAYSFRVGGQHLT